MQNTFQTTPVSCRNRTIFYVDVEGVFIKLLCYHKTAYPNDSSNLFSFPYFACYIILWYLRDDVVKSFQLTKISSKRVKNKEKWPA